MTIKKDLDPKDTICRDLWAYPVVDLTRPRVRTCCKRYGEFIKPEQFEQHKKDVFLNLPSTIEERKQLMQGTQASGCKACWDLENNGQQSFRLGKPDFDYHFNNNKGEPVHYSNYRKFDELINDTSDNVVKSTMPNKLDIMLGTYCDQKCVYCCADFSTQWEAEESRFGNLLRNDPRKNKFSNLNYDFDLAKPYPDVIPINNQTIDNWYETFLEWFDDIYEHLERIALLGGEPTYTPLFKPVTDHIIKRLNEKHHPNCTLTIVSNMNWKKDVLEQIINLRKSLPSSVKLIIEVSMESVGDRAEYIRKGVDWNRFLFNLKEASKHVEIILNPTINGLCITSLLDYFKEMHTIEKENNVNFKIAANQVVFPKWTSIFILDKSFSKYVRECINWLRSTYGDDEKKHNLILMLEDIDNTLNTHVDRQLLGYAIVWFNEIDIRRKQDFLTTFPEYTELFTLGKEFIEPEYTKQHMKQWTY